jgi:hypothetical protein
VPTVLFGPDVNLCSLVPTYSRFDFVWLVPAKKDLTPVCKKDFTLFGFDGCRAKAVFESLNWVEQKSQLFTCHNCLLY